jgi:hypothetical protein
LAATLHHVELFRPMPRTFLANVLQAAYVTLREVRINRLTSEVFHASARIEGGDGLRSVDARPSDALNLAALTGVPIREATEMFEAVARIGRVLVDPETLVPLRIADSQDLRDLVRSLVEPTRHDAASHEPVRLSPSDASSESATPT